MLNSKVAFKPYLQFLFGCKTQNSFIIRDIAYLEYKDCLIEYGFLRGEITEMVESYSQYQVRESLQFYELVVIMLEINQKIKLFYDMKQDIKWFVVDKKQLTEIENFISKAKLLNTAQFKKSLMVQTSETYIRPISYGKFLSERTYN